jgi:hypothetical protein
MKKKKGKTRKEKRGLIEKYGHLVDRNCFFCGKDISEDDIVSGNYPVEAKDIPGYVHRKCRGSFSANNVVNPVSETSLEGMIL